MVLLARLGGRSAGFTLSKDRDWQILIRRLRDILFPCPSVAAVIKPWTNASFLGWDTNYNLIFYPRAQRLVCLPHSTAFKQCFLLLCEGPPPSLCTFSNSASSYMKLLESVITFETVFPLFFPLLPYIHTIPHAGAHADPVLFF